MLSIVATPIGNLKDITLRALECLKSVNLILAEDTRHAKILLSHYGISTPLMSLHRHNEQARIEMIVERLEAGESLALISDAGTPLISDPGALLIQKLRERGCDQIQAIPGPCALIAGLSIAGVDTQKFRFEGFLPPKSSAREGILKRLTHESCTLIFYEAPHRLKEMLLSIQKVFEPTRKIVLAKELTKIHEGIYSGTLEKILEWLNADERRFKGEFVVMIEGAPLLQDRERMRQVSLEVDQILKVLLESLSQKEAVHIAEQLTSLKRNDLYDRALRLKENSDHQ